MPRGGGVRVCYERRADTPVGYGLIGSSLTLAELLAESVEIF